MRVTDGRTDGQNYDSQDRASIAAWRSNNKHHVQCKCISHMHLFLGYTLCSKKVDHQTHSGNFVKS